MGCIYEIQKTEGGEVTMEQQKKNMFIESVKKFLNKNVTVFFFDNHGEENKISGFCESIDFIQRSVILRTKDKKILIPRYKYMERARSNPDVK